ncbi:MAG: hypothetical protein JWN94_465 [Betaproteobacteria bacterium]|nr:hypothetical protein [Betaproteobacteria bacterium]
MNPACEFDHLVVGARTLEQGVAFIEDLLGAAPQTGGRHLAMGTHNKVLRLGARSYLEVIAIDPAGVAPARPRWFGLDDEAVRERLRESPRLLTWAARTPDIQGAVRRCEMSPGAIHPMTRGSYQWRITIPDDGALVCAGLMPTLIQWDCAAHPADNLHNSGCSLIKIEGAHPESARIATALGASALDQLIKVRSGVAVQLIATLRGPRGLCKLTS